jgi:hypothetical protein
MLALGRQPQFGPSPLYPAQPNTTHLRASTHRAHASSSLMPCVVWQVGPRSCRSSLRAYFSLPQQRGRDRRPPQQGANRARNSGSDQRTPLTSRTRLHIPHLSLARGPKISDLPGSARAAGGATTCRVSQAVEAALPHLASINPYRELSSARFLTTIAARDTPR